MKTKFLILLLLMIGTGAYAQNTFPSSGNAAINTAPLSDVQLLVNGLIRGIGGGFQLQNPGNTPDGSWVSISGPQGRAGIAIAEGDGSGNIARRWDMYVKGYNFCIRDNNISGTTPRFVITTAGNIGIGTSDPTQRLEVNGTIHSKEVKVDNDNWPDYVFGPGYARPSLSEVEAFVQQNGHLPEIPSAKEVARNGVNLSEMNGMLLKKIEELTLYLVEEKNKRLEMEKELGTLKDELKAIEVGIKQ